MSDLFADKQLGDHFGSEKQGGCDHFDDLRKDTEYKSYKAKLSEVEGNGLVEGAALAHGLEYPADNIEHIGSEESNDGYAYKLNAQRAFCRADVRCKLRCDEEFYRVENEGGFRMGEYFVAEEENSHSGGDEKTAAYEADYRKNLCDRTENLCCFAHFFHDDIFLSKIVFIRGAVRS